MQSRLMAAALASLAVHNAQAFVTTPATDGGSELIFAISSSSNSAFSYTHDLGVTVSGFNPAQSYAFTLSSSFNEFLKPSNYDPGFSNDEDLIQGAPPDPLAGFAQADVRWGVVGAELSSGASRILSTWSSLYNLDEDSDPTTPPTFTDLGTGDPVVGAAQVMQQMIAANPTDPGGDKRNVNELPGHSAPGDGFNLTTAATIASDATYQGSAAYNFQAAFFFSGQDYATLFGPAAGMDAGFAQAGEIVTMYMFNEGFDGNSQIVGVGQGNGFGLGQWFLDYSGVDLSDPENPTGNVVLRYQVVPVPAAVWLLGSALLGLLGVSRRRVAHQEVQ